ncbi:hypothetical protein AB0M79_34040 [Polymorphospora sp. NPDC051019]|uniref:hypothetical protein n=1 Tax=Polymorphospora sp. NPDC051019 TaxID=3155725 RepID=UPI00342209DF
MKPRQSRLLRLLVVFTALLMGLTIGATPAGAQTPGPRAAFSDPSAKPADVVVQAPGAPIVCHVSYGNDVTVYDGFLNVTWSVACRWTDDGQLATETRAIYMRIGIAQHGAVLAPVKTCLPEFGPSGTCSHRVPFNGVSGHVQSVMEATVTWNDGYQPIFGVFASPGSIVT